MSSPSIRLHQPKVRQSIRTRLLALLLGLTTISVLAVGYLGVSSVQSVGESAQQISAEALRTQAEEYLRQITVGDAQRNDLILGKVQRDAENVAQYAAAIFEKPDAFAGGTYWQAEDQMFTAPDGQYKNDETDISSAFVPDFVDIDEELLTILELSAYLDFVLVPTCESDPNTVAVYMSTERETTRYHPNIDLGTIVPPDFQITQRPWYFSANPENNPERTVVWSPIYVDATGHGLMVTAAAPIYTSLDGFIGAVGIDVTLENISASIEETRLLGSGYSFLVDDTGRAIALPEQGYQDILDRSLEPDEVGADLSEATTGFAPVLANMMAGSTGFDILEVSGRELFVAYAPLESTGWSLANVAETETMLQVMLTLGEELETWTRSLVLARILPVGGIILVVMAAIGLLLTQRLVNPIQKIATAAQQIGAGQWDVPLPRAGNDEIGVLARAFNQMTGQLRDLYTGLEEKVAARTRDLEHRTAQLESLNTIAAAISQVLDPDEVLNLIARQAADLMGAETIALPLLNEDGVHMTYVAAYGRLAATVIRQVKSLSDIGICTWVMRTQQEFYSADLAADERESKEIREALGLRTVISVPMFSKGKLIGAITAINRLDGGLFTRADIEERLRPLAYQAAIAIENARLLEEAQDRLQEVGALLGSQSRKGWKRIAAEQPGWGYSYDGVEVTPRDAQSATSTVEEEPRLTVPLKVRGEAIGRLNLALGDRPLTGEDRALAQAVADQASQALERARLFQETQRVLRETESLYRAGQAIGAATSVEKVGQALMDYAVTSGGVDVARVLLFEHDDASGDGAGQPTDMVMREGWTVDDRPAQPYGTRLPLEDYPLADLMDATEPIIVEDVLTDPRANEATRTLIATISGLRSFAMIPISVGERWIGVVFVGRNKPSTLTEDLIRGYWTLAGQAAITLESMRLLDETRRRAARERLTREITDKMRRAVDMDTLMQTSIQEMAVALGTSSAFVQLSTPPELSGDGRGL